MVPTDQQLRDFVEVHGSTSFNHAAAVLPLFEPGAASTWEVHPRDIIWLRETFQIRARRFADQPPTAPYPETLAADVIALSHALNAAKDQEVRRWTVTLPDGTSYHLFELVSDRKLAGAVRSVNRLIVDPVE